ncbi:MAG: LytTR family transcriptional regulator DNA-binding domain-containing protein [Bacteroidales bacterium]|nr:LytTR family transcriptional regulator DNA-binding domain-containing protein [Bacteroidales bacterium]
MNHWSHGKEIQHKFILERNFMFLTLVAILFFSIPFLYLYAPFAKEQWLSLTNQKSVVTTVAFYLITIAVLLICRLVLNGLKEKFEINRLKYVLWGLAEVLLVALCYCFYTIYLVYGQDNMQMMVDILPRAAICSLLIIGIPQTALIVYFTYHPHDFTPRVLREGVDFTSDAPANAGPALPNAAPAQPQSFQTVGGAVADAAEEINMHHFVNFSDYAGKLRFTADIESLYYIESHDNYVIIYYDKGGVINFYMLRASTGSIEESLAGTPIVRCHRSYLVNGTKIKAIRREKTSILLELDHDSVKPIPVSQTYAEYFVGNYSV